MLICQTCNQIYNQVLVSRSCSKLNLRHATSLGFGLKEVKIALNMVKVCVHTYLPNGNLNLWLNFNSEKLVKSETRFYGFSELGIKGGEIFWEASKFHMHACLSNGHSNLWSNFNYKNLLKSETSSCIFARVGLKGGQNSLERCKSWRACLFIYVRNPCQSFSLPC